MSVVIIGAGISGLKTASALYMHGAKNIKVLESRGRIGGRLQTVTGFDGIRKYDLGASWHHDTLCNDLFSEGVEAGEKYIFDDDFFIYIDKERGRVDRDSEMRLEIIDREINKYTDIEYYQKLGSKDVSFQELTTKYLFEKRKYLTDDQIRYSAQVSRYLELWHGIDWKQLSAKDTYFGHQGRNAMALNYDSTVDRIVKTFPKEIIELNTEVNSVKQDKNRVIITTKDNKKYEADYCVVTIPQSVLELSINESAKQETGRIEFDPPLNNNIRKGFKSVHFGGLGKVIFEFEKICWDRSDAKIVTLAQTSGSFVDAVRQANTFDDLLRYMDKENSRMVTRDCWNQPLYFNNLAKGLDMASFMMLMQSPLTEYIESIQDDKDKVFNFFQPALDSVLKSLGAKNVVNGMNDLKLTFEDNVPVLRNVIVTNWTQEPYSRGAYTACFPGDDALDMIVALDRGQSSRIRFAGEHTVMDGAGCVYGAWKSGQREADYIAERMNLQ
ncbi:similar to Saccharomyces cerevisiae YMR020W FMS1 Polyamine oxidase, converts spermine to spermidine, which is required for the essential hypusination modification of translation factor eIF-5A [Maudiozyma barnettii]|uniref:Similar to Saccharomyces cerevisiae YMR020W FMS1 Polyamine oxidase, converts spermine to spermidine, which is required for the essential hypusination modification of translation factor eIF-5A n=1 Tax=Maudiozyma barnettii TaxID=61262 RepID=A0A8H2VKD3_9SACH|nr:polyamine oxidase [Kazachstania barnettii]CAB4256905.1 similar to Saccharomyces cerevisiae YMR020W FMS1 Polyamine oxidase, converts spermine to spermidine, which is required for the essential hypusination modification of translation factor eIF-5A [Kazachstania barnettii]CAD1785510.1 similar to Saccharomyces cerevisiae YMR020W FMS1 Polyamine oxidase, converts spermine to spermidine, which is required for the essential hypusination modification of translation factor eIF-5A [Kazachstania barnetti